MGSSAIQCSISSTNSNRKLVAVLGGQRHRLQADGLQRGRNLGFHLTGTRKVASLDFLQQDLPVAVSKGRLSGQQAIERGPQAVDIAGGAQLGMLPLACSGLM